MTEDIEALGAELRKVIDDVVSVLAPKALEIAELTHLCFAGLFSGIDEATREFLVRHQIDATHELLADYARRGLDNCDTAEEIASRLNAVFDARLAELRAAGHSNGGTA